MLRSHPVARRRRSRHAGAAPSVRSAGGRRRLRGLLVPLRRELAAVLALLVSTCAIVLGAVPAHAAHPSEIDVDASAELVVTALEQPQDLGEPGDGRPVDSDAVPVPGVTYTLTEVSLTSPLNTVAGWKSATALTPEEARDRLLPATATSVTTDAHGTARFPELPVGVYLVEETALPTGVMPTEPFLVTLPVVDPVDSDSWLYRVHVQPKAAAIDLDLQVVDRTAVTTADPVRWRAVGALPRAAELTDYSMSISVPTGLTVLEHPAVELRGSARAALPELSAEDVEWSISEGELHLEFGPSGLEALTAARAQDPAAVVELSFRTTAEGNGSRTVTGAVRAALPGGAAVEVTDTATSTFGPLAASSVDRDDHAVPVPGAGVRLHLSPEDAAAGRDPVEVDGRDIWYTDQEGRLRIDGLRSSGLVDGLDREERDPLHRTYYVILAETPPGYTGSPHPLALTVTSPTDPPVAVIELWREDSSGSGPGEDGGGDGTDGTGGEDGDDGGSGAGGDGAGSGAGGDGSGGTDGTEEGEGGTWGGPLAMTGAQVLGAGLLALVLLALGALLVSRRNGSGREPQGTDEP